MCRRKADASTRTRNISRSIPRKFSSFAAALCRSRQDRPTALGRTFHGFFHTREFRDSTAIASDAIHAVEPEDLLSFGLIPEFIGRLPVVSTLDVLTEEDLVTILTDPKSAMVKQYTKLMAMDGVGLTFTKDALRALAAEAVRKGTGARRCGLCLSASCSMSCMTPRAAKTLPK